MYVRKLIPKCFLKDENCVEVWKKEKELHTAQNRNKQGMQHSCSMHHRDHPTAVRSYVKRPLTSYFRGQGLLSG